MHRNIPDNYKHVIKYVRTYTQAKKEKSPSIGAQAKRRPTNYAQANEGPNALGEAKNCPRRKMPKTLNC